MANTVKSVRRASKQDGGQDIDQPGNYPIPAEKCYADLEDLEHRNQAGVSARKPSLDDYDRMASFEELR